MGNFEVVTEDQGWSSRGTLVAKREAQNQLLSRKTFPWYSPPKEDTRRRLLESEEEREEREHEEKSRKNSNNLVVVWEAKGPDVLASAALEEICNIELQITLLAGYKETPGDTEAACARDFSEPPSTCMPVQGLRKVF